MKPEGRRDVVGLPAEGQREVLEDARRRSVESFMHDPHRLVALVDVGRRDARPAPDHAYFVKRSHDGAGHENLHGNQPVFQGDLKGD